jgi:hypothetical protein
MLFLVGAQGPGKALIVTLRETLILPNSYTCFSRWARMGLARP